MNRSPLIAYMMTPQAAPETHALRRLRFVWMALCTVLALGAAGIRLWVALFGLWISALVIAIVLATIVVGVVYFAAKTRADDDWASRKREP